MGKIILTKQDIWGVLMSNNILRVALYCSNRNDANLAFVASAK